MISSKKQSRLTAVLFLMVMIIAPLAILYLPSKLIIPGDIHTTASNIAGNPALLRIVIVGETLIAIIEVCLSALIYRLFREANKSFALVMASFRFMHVIIEAVNIIIQLMLLELLSNPSYMTDLGMNQTSALASLLIKGHDAGVLVWQVFFAVHLILLGILALRSGYLPKIISGLLIIAGLGYLGDDCLKLFFEGNAIAGTIVSILLVFSTLGEVLLTFWLLFKGIKPSPKETNDFS